MRVNRSIFFFAFLTSFINLDAQEKKALPLKKFRLFDISIQTGENLTRLPATTLNDFRKLAPQSELLKNDFSSFELYDRKISAISEAYSALIGIQFLRKDKTDYHKNVNLRIGLYYANSTMSTGAVYSEQQSSQDTLVSIENGQISYIDSTIRESYGMYYSGRQFSLSTSLIFRTDTERRLTLYGGLGINLGLSLHTKTHIYHSQIYQIDTTDEQGYTNSDYIISTENNPGQESFENKSALITQVYLPVGIDLRLSNKNNFLKSFHIYSEANAGLVVTRIPEIGAMGKSSLSYFLGLRYIL